MSAGEETVLVERLSRTGKSKLREVPLGVNMARIGGEFFVRTERTLTDGTAVFARPELAENLAALGEVGAVSAETPEGWLSDREITRESHPALFKLLDSVAQRPPATKGELPEVKRAEPVHVCCEACALSAQRGNVPVIGNLYCCCDAAEADDWSKLPPS